MRRRGGRDGGGEAGGGGGGGAGGGGGEGRRTVGVHGIQIEKALTADAGRSLLLKKTGVEGGGDETGSDGSRGANLLGESTEPKEQNNIIITKCDTQQKRTASLAASTWARRAMSSNEKPHMTANDEWR